jgi:hypothetical protein
MTQITTTPLFYIYIYGYWKTNDAKTTCFVFYDFQEKPN